MNVVKVRLRSADYDSKTKAAAEAEMMLRETTAVKEALEAHQQSTRQ